MACRRRGGATTRSARPNNRNVLLTLGIAPSRHPFTKIRPSQQLSCGARSRSHIAIKWCKAVVPIGHMGVALEVIEILRA